MSIKRKMQACYDLFILIKAYITCPTEIYAEGRDMFEYSIIECLRYAKTGKKTW